MGPNRPTEMTSHYHRFQYVRCQSAPCGQLCISIGNNRVLLTKPAGLPWRTVDAPLRSKLPSAGAGSQMENGSGPEPPRTSRVCALGRALLVLLFVAGGASACRPREPEASDGDATVHDTKIVREACGGDLAGRHDGDADGRPESVSYEQGGRPGWRRGGFGGA